MNKKHVIVLSAVLFVIVLTGIVLIMNKDDGIKPIETTIAKSTATEAESSTTLLEDETTHVAGQENTTRAIPDTTEKEPSTAPVEDVSLVFPEEFIIDWSITHYLPEREYRFGYYATQLVKVESVPGDELVHWIADQYEWDMLLASGKEPQEPSMLAAIKHFNITFKEFERATKKDYLLNLKLNLNMSDEEFEIPNPYILYTFNLEQINDYYSVDPARNASARKWLEEWLKTNKLYGSYLEYQQSNTTIGQ